MKFFTKAICAGLTLTLLVLLTACTGGEEPAPVSNSTPKETSGSSEAAQSGKSSNLSDFMNELEADIREPLPDQGLDFKSATDSETGKTISLGDAKEKIDGIFGEGVLSDIPDYYLYLDEKLKVKYIDGEAALINIYLMDRFSIPGFDTGMEEEEILESFHLFEANEENKAYQAFYDLGDNPVSNADPHFIVSVAYENGKYKSIAIVNQILLTNQ